MDLFIPTGEQEAFKKVTITARISVKAEQVGSGGQQSHRASFWCAQVIIYK